MTTRSKRKPGQVSVTATHSVPSLADKVTADEFSLPDLDVGENPASVNYAVSLTHNLGHYESLRISVGVTLPSRPTNIVATAEVAKRIAHSVYDRSMTEWVGPAAGRRSPHYRPPKEEPEPQSPDDIDLETDPDFPED